MSRDHSHLKEQQDCDYAEAVILGVSGVERFACQDEDEVRDGGLYDLREDVGRHSGQVKGDELTSEVSRKYEDASILKGDTSSKENRQSSIELESRNMVCTADLLTGVSMDGSAYRFLQHVEQGVKDDTTEDEQMEQAVKDATEQTVNEETVDNKNLEQAVKDAKVVEEYIVQSAKDESVDDKHLEPAVNDETVRDELPPDGKVISAKALLQQHVDMDSQDWSVLLPEEVVLILFKFMKPGDVLAASQTCRLWRKLGEDDKLWQQICKEAHLAFSLTEKNLKSLERRNKKASIVYSAWKENFLKPYKIAKNFREEDPQVFTAEMSHDVNQIKIFDDKIVTTCKNKLYVFCALSVRLEQELVGHTSDVEFIEIEKRLIVSGCHYSVKVWNVDTGSCLHTLLIRTVDVDLECLQIHGTVVVSFDGKLRMWDVREGRCFKIIRGHIGGTVNHLQFDGRLVVFGTKSLIKIWDIDTVKCLRTLYPEKDFKSIKLQGGHLLVIHYDGSIKLWDMDTGVCRHTLVGINEGYMELLGDLLVSRSRTNAKIWSLSTGACLHTLDGREKHSLNINVIGINHNFVVTSSWDGKVILWDVKTGEFIRYLSVLEPREMVVKVEMTEAKIVFVVHVHALGVQTTKLLVLNFDFTRYE